MMRLGWTKALCLLRQCSYKMFRLCWGVVFLPGHFIKGEKKATAVFVFEKALTSTIWSLWKDISCVPLSWTLAQNPECFPAVAVPLQLLQHTWGRTGRTSAMAPCQRQICYTDPSLLLALADEWRHTVALTHAVIICIPIPYQCPAKVWTIT